MGATALAAILNKTKITELECVIPSLLCQQPASHTVPPSISRRLGCNTIGYKGGSALAAILKGTQITKLQCAPTPSVLFCVSALDCTAYIHSLCTARHLTYILCSLGCNAIGDEGASALAAILNETMISTLEYATPPPDLTHSLTIFILLLARKGSLAIKSDPRAPLRLPISSTRQISPTWSAPPPTKCLLYFSSAPLDTRIDTPRSRVAGWPETSSAASTAGGTAPTPRRAPSSSARGSRGAP